MAADRSGDEVDVGAALVEDRVADEADETDEVEDGELEPRKGAGFLHVKPVVLTEPTTSGPGSGNLTSSLAVVVH